MTDTGEDDEEVDDKTPDRIPDSRNLEGQSVVAISTGSSDPKMPPAPEPPD